MAILIVDDTEDARTFFERVLNTNGHGEVVVVDSAAMALRALGLEGDTPPAAPFDLVLMDLTMRGLDGIETCRRIREDPRTQDIPILIITARGETRDLLAAFSAGASDYIAKPVHPEVLQARVRHALRLKAEIDRRKERERQLLEMQIHLEKANERLHRLAASDGLTGLANRRHFDERLDYDWKRGQRERKAVSLVMIDLDRFKLYNDLYGHVAGDECLRTVAAAVERAVHRASDLAARYGGEEFAVVLPCTDLAGAAVVAQRIHAELSALAIPHAASPIAAHVTASVGVASVVPNRFNTPSALIQAADAALYQAKHDGGNCIRPAPEENPNGAAGDGAADEEPSSGGQ
jgi:diguanylate cyclase (GGDEF)-like protein